MQPPKGSSHAECEFCDGTGFQAFEREGYSYVRPCPKMSVTINRPPEPKSISARAGDPGGWKRVGDFEVYEQE